jgi:hypothetical protein
VNSAAVTSVTIDAPGTAQLNTIATTTVRVNIGAIPTAINTTVTLRAKWDAVPTGSLAAIGFSATGKTMVDTTTSAAALSAAVLAANAATNELQPAKYTLTPATDKSVAVTSSTTNTAGSVGFVPDKNGTYTFTVWHDLDQDGVVDSGEQADQDSFVVGNATTAVTMSSIGGTASASGTYGALIKILVKDSAGAVSGLSSSESISLAATGATVTVRSATGGSSGTTIDAGDVVNGVAYANVVSTENATASITLTATGSGGNVGSLSGSLAIAFKAVDTSYTATWTRDTDGALDQSSSTDTTVDVPLGASSVVYEMAAATAGLAAAAYVSAQVTDTSGRLTGSASAANGGFTGLAFDRAALVATDLTTSFTFSMTSLVIGNAYSVTIGSGSGSGASATSHTAATVATGAVVISNDYIAAKTAGSVAITAAVTDNFGSALPNALVTITSSSASRNYAPAGAITSVTKSSDADGNVSFTWTDLSTSTLLYSDAITVSANYNGTGAEIDTATVIWSATGPVASTLTILGGNNTTTGVAAATVQTKDISAADGVEAGVQTFTATVKDAAGNLLQGVACTWTVSGTTAAVLSTKATTYTGALGTCTTSVYAWVAGTYTVTGTAAGATGTATVAFAQTAAGEERTISAKVEGSIVTVTAVDRLGNAVPGVTIYATRTAGIGYFGTGVTKTSTTTNSSGIAEFAVTGGLTISLSTISPDAVAGTYGSGQTSALAGKKAAATTPVAFTAYTAGTATTAEEGVGASFDAAGVATVSATVVADTSSLDTAQAAADAAAEATDAANAATDAANAAAEAADAATAAAQDAADAVAALSAQVATLISGLKAQLTALTNLVIKIQKKVKA